MNIKRNIEKISVAILKNAWGPVSRLTGRNAALASGDESVLFCLAYHDIRPQVPAALSGMDIVVGESLFRSHIDFLVKNFNCLGIEQLSNRSNSKKPSMLITFDDGFLGVYKHALPILKEYNCPAVVFITTDFLDGNLVHWRIGLNHMVRSIGDYRVRTIFKKRGIDVPRQHSVIRWTKESFQPKIISIINDYIKESRADLYKDIFINWSQIKQMQECGISFGVHTCSHPVMSALTFSQQELEIRDSVRIFSERLGSKPVAYAHPFGKPLHCNQDTVTLLKKYLPNKPAFFSGGGCNYLAQSSLKYLRVGVHNWDLNMLLATLNHHYLFNKQKRVSPNG